MAPNQKPKPSHFTNDQDAQKRDAYKQLIASLSRLINDYPPDSIPIGGGIYYGPISVAYLFFVLSRMYAEDLKVEGHTLDIWAAQYLKRAQTEMKTYPGPSPERCGVTDDIMAILAIDAASTRDVSMVEEFCKFSRVASNSKGSPEWLYGRAGYLYFLRFIKVCFADNPEVKDMIDEAADDVIDSIMDSPRPWKWKDTAYVGAVHGMIGIITQLVLTDSALAGELEADLSVLLSYQYDSGNWPSSIPPGRDRLVQVCHGAPGVVISLLSIRDFFPKLKDKIDRCIARGRECIVERGLLTKEPCLCHGISGNALALESPQFEHFLSFTTAHEIRGLDKDGLLEHSRDPSGLWTGEAGRAWAWAVADRGLEKRLLGYNDV